MHDVCRILLVDDHKLLMEGIRSLLAPHSHLRVAGMAPDGKEAWPPPCLPTWSSWTSPCRA